MRVASDAAARACWCQIRRILIFSVIPPCPNLGHFLLLCVRAVFLVRYQSGADEGEEQGKTPSFAPGLILERFDCRKAF